MMHTNFRGLMVSGLILFSLPTSMAPVLAAQLQDRPMARMMANRSHTSADKPTEYAYGAEALQKLDFWHATATGPAALVVFVHGGGWKRGDKRNATGAQKVEHLTGEGYAFASINYRLVPDATVEQQAADVAAGLAWLKANAGQLGIDASRIVLMGHSAGAHLAALVATDSRYLAAAGLALSDLRGVILLDGACYDVPGQIAAGNRFMGETYLEAFGSDPARQRSLSPTLQAITPQSPPFLIAHIDRADGKSQSEALGAALVKAGASAEVHGFEGTGMRGHMEINRSLGNTAYPATAVVDAWLDKRLRNK